MKRIFVTFFRSPWNSVEFNFPVKNTRKYSLEDIWIFTPNTDKMHSSNNEKCLEIIRRGERFYALGPVSQSNDTIIKAKFSNIWIGRLVCIQVWLHIIIFVDPFNTVIFIYRYHRKRFGTRTISKACMCRCFRYFFHCWTDWRICMISSDQRKNLRKWTVFFQPKKNYLFHARECSIVQKYR